MLVSHVVLAIACENKALQSNAFSQETICRMVRFVILMADEIAKTSSASMTLFYTFYMHMSAIRYLQVWVTILFGSNPNEHQFKTVVINNCNILTRFFFQRGIVRCHEIFYCASFASNAKKMVN